MLLATLLLAVASAHADSGDASAARGRRLYREGIGADGRAVTALSGTAGLPLPSAFVACVQCHGDDGRGKTEAGRTVPDIRGETLDVPVSTLADGRRRSPYDTARFLTALTQGLDSSGHTLDTTMPRYRLSEKEAADILDYLKTIGIRSDEGVTEDTVRIGFLASTDPAQAEMTRIDRQVIDACFEEINHSGGIHRRQIVLQEIDSKSACSEPVLALLTDVLTASTPVSARVSLLCVSAEERRDEADTVFSLFPGATERARALASYAVEHGLGQPVVPKADVREDTLKSWRDAGVKAVQLSGLDPKQADFEERAHAVGWNPWLLWREPPPVAMADAKGVTVDSLAMLSIDALAEHRRWAVLHNLPASDFSRQVAMLSTARLLAEALKGAGHELSREKFVAALESVHSFRTGLTQPLGFSPRRHTATTGVYVVPCVVGPTSPAPEWVLVE